MDDERLKKQIDFILETDKLKKIYRKTYLADGTRFENDAEHSWHLALMAILLSEYSNRNVDILKVIKMVIIHDIIEIDAGDAYCYDEAANEGKAEREMDAAKRIFALLPDDQHNEFMDLWLEFEENKSAEANFANALDRFQPVNLNYASGGVSWQENSITSSQVINRNLPIEKGSERLWEYTKKIIDSALQKNYIKYCKK
jgi:putative hydrolase of HD superfamily